MAVSVRETLVPPDAEQAAATVRALSREGRTMRIRGGGTKLAWGRPVEADAELSARRLDQVLEHNRGDFTITVQPGVRLAELQDHLAGAGQRLALDPPLGASDAATVGGVVATGDAGPLRHRYGGPRDLLLGLTVVLADGEVAKAGGRVIKNVAGYDLAKLYAGSFGTLGLISRLVLRLHPLPRDPVTVIGSSPDPAVLARTAHRLAGGPLEPERLDVSWAGEVGQVMIEVAGVASAELARRAERTISEAGLEADSVTGEDAEQLWDRQRSAQRTAAGAILRVSARQVQLPRLLEVSRQFEASLVGRVAHAVVWLRLPPAGETGLAERIARLRRECAPAHCAVMDAPEDVRRDLDPFGIDELPERRLMAELKSRFDPSWSCNPGLFAEGI